MNLFSPVQDEGKNSKYKLRELLRNKKVLLIDDEWDKGIRETLEIISENIICVIGDTSWRNEIPETVLNKVKDKLQKSLIDHQLDYDLILLDLYLTEKDKEILKESRTPENLKKYTSYMISEWIRNEIRDQVPIILFTASNKAYNVEIMREAGIDDYFPKEPHYIEDEAKEYYLRLKNSIRQLLSQERMALREIWRGIKIYNNKKNPSHEVVKLLESSYFSLKAYLDNKQDSYIIGALVSLGHVIEKIHSKTTPIQIFNNMREDKLYRFIAYQIRHTAAHSEAKVTFEDALFALACFLRSYKIDLNFIWDDPKQDWILGEMLAKQMIVSYCNEYCNNSCETGGRYPNGCSETTNTYSLKKSMFLT